jgi:prepilin-type N-terminal cleavage/methylation domain-containing protein
MGKMSKRRGFTLIEVIVALAILMIVVLALLSGFIFYYKYVRDLRFQAIGENLAQLQIEDLRNLPISAVDTLVKGGQYPPQDIYVLPNYPDDLTDGDPELNDDTVYNSGIINGSYRIEYIVDVCGKEDGTVPSLLLPSSIEVNPVVHINGTTYYDYTLVLHKEVYPHYEKQIIITDKTPLEITDPNYKIYEIQVTVYWNNETKHITITGEKSYEGKTQ